MTTNNLFTSANKAAWLDKGRAAMVTEKSAVLSNVAAFAFYALFAGDKAKQELNKACVEAGHYLPKKPDTVNQTFRNRVNASVILIEKDKGAVRDMLESRMEGAEDAALAALVAYIEKHFVPFEGAPLTIANKFLPMLTADWTADQCRAALAGHDTEESEASEAELDKASEEGEAEAEEYAAKGRRLFQQIAAWVQDIPARDGDSYLVLHQGFDTIAAAALKANGVYDVVNQNGVPVTLGAGDAAIVDRLAIEYGRATSHCASIAAEGKRQEVLDAVQQEADKKAQERQALDALAAKYPAKHGKKGQKAA